MDADAMPGADTQCLSPRLSGRGSGASPEGWGIGVAIEEQRAKPALKRPPMYKVVLLNDDYTTKEFVVHVLMLFFGLDQEKAWQLMNAVHTTGRAVVGTFPRDIAETKAEQVNAYAQENEFPLRSVVEMAD